MVFAILAIAACLSRPANASGYLTGRDYLEINEASDRAYVVMGVIDGLITAWDLDADNPQNGVRKKVLIRCLDGRSRADAEAKTYVFLHRYPEHLDSGIATIVPMALTVFCDA
ncbi:MAG: hypothetical protein CVT74_02690 [Alphaproteobacteria bacterium HGW-Alphaproteobacteria-13]|nr:MAG: hypothetical protein CVT74_02690 [Alphaproteobacteria bacterium HGW-Alphaproteobacteria-13]